MAGASSDSLSHSGRRLYRALLVVEPVVEAAEATP